MDMLNLLIRSAAFWTALLSAAGLIFMKYLGVPEDIWGVVLGVLTVIVAVLTGEEFARSIGRQIARTQREYWEAEKKREKYGEYQQIKK